RYGWRAAFLVTGALGLLWLPLWSGASSLAPASAPAPPARKAAHDFAILRSPRLWAFVAANALSMVGYSFWTNFTVSYFKDVHRLSLAGAAAFSWIPFVFAALGGFTGGWLSLDWMRRGAEAVAARTRVCLLMALISLSAAVIPSMPTPVLSAAGI